MWKFLQNLIAIVAVILFFNLVLDLGLFETSTKEDKWELKTTLDKYVEPMDTSIRKQALSIVTDAPSGINVNNDAWKIWAIYYWVSQNGDYVSDPKGQEYYMFAHDMLETMAGDCDDFSILLASMYESVGLDAALATINTDDEPGIDHITCFVYWSGDAQSFIDEENIILNKMGLTSPTEELRVRYQSAETSHAVLGKYKEGVWIVADGTMNYVKGLVGYVTHKPYDVHEFIDVGG